MKVWQKIMVAPAVTIVFLGILGVVSYLALNQQRNSLEDVFKNRFAGYQIASSSSQEISEVHSNVYRLFTWINNLKEDKIKEVTSEQKNKIDTVVKKISIFSNNSATSTSEQKLTASIIKKLNSYKTDIDSAMELSIVDIPTGMASMQTADSQFQNLLKEFGQLVQFEQQMALESYEKANETFNKVITALFVILALAITVSIVIAIYMSRVIVRPLKIAIILAEKISQGDLSSDVMVSGYDETGDLLRALSYMTVQLRDLVKEVGVGAATVADTSSQIASGNVELSQRTEEQSSTLEQTSSSMAHLTSTVNQNTDNAKKANMLSQGASEIAIKGGVVVGEVVTTMTEIAESSKKISDIIGVIDSIAFQTNILALNAAVEAARAGEQGRGFAVVAAEVRNLAQRSAEAAKEIKGLISNSGEKVRAGSKLVGTAGETMKEIVGAVKKVSTLIAEISAASQEQSDGIGQVNKAIVHMEQVVQQNATLVEEATAATEAMKEQAGALLATVARFKVDKNNE